jgi:hypothetical protein
MPFSSSLLLKAASTVLVLSMLVASRPGAVTPMSSVPDLLQGAHRSAHFSYLFSFILEPMP